MTKDIAKLLSDFKEDIRQELKGFRDTFERDLKTELREIRNGLKEISEIKDSMNFINKEFETFKVKMTVLVTENSVLKKENTEMRAEMVVLNKALKEAENRLVNCEQYSRNNNIEVKGILKDETVNAEQLIMKLGDVIGEPITKADVEACHWVPTKDSDKSNIIVRFMHRNMRDSVLDKAKKKRISCRDLDQPSDAPVFVNEHLCPYLKKLLGMAVSKKREHLWRFVWVRNGKILAKKSVDTPVISVSHEDDLRLIC